MPSRLARAGAVLVTFAALLVTAAWLLLNVVFATKYISGVDVLELAKYAPYISRVDVSAANTLIFFLTNLFLFIGTVRYCAACGDPSKLQRICNPHFPFPLRFKVLLVQLGLLGTVFAFIIAFNRLAGSSAEAQHRYDPALLVVPLGAALWSTFAGIAFAYIVVPAIQKLFSSLLRVDSDAGDVARDVRDVAESFVSLKGQIVDTCDQLGRVNERLERTESQLSAIGQSSLLASVHKLGDVAAATAQAANSLKSTGTDFLAAAGTITEATSGLRHELRTIHEDITALSRALAQQNQTTTAQVTASGQLEQEIRSAARIAVELLTALKAVSTELPKNIHNVGEQLKTANAEVRALATLIGISRRSRAQITGTHVVDLRKNGNGTWRWNPMVLINSFWSKSFRNERRP